MAEIQPHFETHPQPLAYLLEQIHNRALALPDFQRDFVWEPSDTQDLVASVASFFPAGTLLFLDQEGGRLHFKPREVKGAPELNGAEPQTLVLDGQQRLTALYQVLYGEGQYRYFVDMNVLLEGATELDSALSYLPEKRAEKALGTVEQQAAELKFPLAGLRDPGFSEWLDEVIEQRERGDEHFETKPFRKKMRSAHKAHLKTIEDYSFPVVDLPKSTKLEAVCKIFETLNRTGLKLTVFELLVARFWPKGISLRELWDQAKERHDVLEDYEVDPYWLLQSICLRSGGPSPSVQRGNVLRLESSAINAHWEETAEGCAKALEMLRDDCGVLSAKWLPYSAVLVPLAALWPKLASFNGPAVGKARRKLAQYFWCAVFAGAFDASPNSAAVKHYQELSKWLDGGPEPEVVRSLASRFDGGLLLEAKIGQRALYRGVMALTIRHGALDFHKMERLTAKKLTEQRIDAHHVFPKAWLEAHANAGTAVAESPDLILNRALIDKETNRTIKAKAPSAYLGEIGVDLHDELPKILASHLLPAEPDSGLLEDDYGTFLLERQQLVLEELERVSGQALSAEG